MLAARAWSQDGNTSSTKNLSGTDAEITVVETFGTISAAATQNVTTMQTLLDRNPQWPDLLSRLNEEWDYATNRLSGLANITDDKLSVVRENAIAVILKQFRDSRGDIISRINTRIKKKKSIKEVDLIDLRRYLDAVGVLLNGVNASGTAELEILQQQISRVPESATLSKAGQNRSSDTDRNLLPVIAKCGIEFRNLWRKLPE